MTLSRRGLMAAAGCLTVPSLAWPETQPEVFPLPTAPKSRPGALRSLYVPMSDGTRIALDVVLPEGGSARAPAVLIMTRYWRAERGAGLNEDEAFWTSRGCAVVFGDVRGTGASFGQWPYHRSRKETLDLGEVIDWIVRQPWSDGRVIGWGLSYTANTADWMVERGRPALKGAISRFADHDPYADLYFPGGVPNRYMGENWGRSSKDLDLNILEGHPESPGVRPVDADPNGTLLRQAIARRRDVPSVWEGLRQVTFRDDRPTPWGGASFEDWGIYNRKAALEQAGTPMQSWASWMDSGTANGVLHRLNTLSNPQHAFIGAWSHGGIHDADPFAPVDAPPGPPFPNQQGADLAFAEAALAGTAGPRGRKRLSYYTMGEGAWKTTEVWPPAAARPLRLHLAAGGALAVAAPEQVEAGDAYAVDFAASTGKTTRWATNNNGGDVVYPDRREADRQLLTFTGPPLHADLEITGHPLVTLFVAVDAPDCAFFAYLEAVEPDGTVRYVTEGQLRAIHRKLSPDTPYWIFGPVRSFKRADAQPMTPGEVTRIAFALMPTSVLLRAGQRIRLALAGADADTFARIPADGPVNWRLHRERNRPSALELPVVPRRPG